jgi:mannose-6-phosphate isomerase-like protein (cupin superfamily)
MPIVHAENAPSFTLPGLTVRGLAAPSRGSSETSAWRLSIAPGAPGVPHSVDREELFLALGGTAIATLGEERLELCAGDVLIVPAGQVFSLANPGAVAFEAIAVAPVGVRARLPGGEPFAPPWTE